MGEPFLRVVDSYESYELRTSFTSREKEMSIRQMHLIVALRNIPAVALWVIRV